MGMDVMIVAACIVGAYLLGSVPFGWLIGKARGVDIREHGSRNIGATNCWRVCGWPYGLAAFALDVAKGFLPVYAAVLYMPGVMAPPEDLPGGLRTFWLLLVLVAAAAIAGHVFPVWLKFKGGKAVATSLGVLLALPMLGWLALGAFGVWIVVVLITRYVSVASSAAAIAFAAGYLWLERGEVWNTYLPVTVFVLLLVLIILMRHRSNYARLMKGTENKLWGGKKSP
ncbi:MAG: glycerol-3-phosphate 1-O-acyltransferase PlsY [Planctomycetes bacterium]|nr:glycerol-3-phosphate 1-O-acyltransferase PlsY [Planctomycetota bacterium]